MLQSCKSITFANLPLICGGVGGLDVGACPAELLTLLLEDPELVRRFRGFCCDVCCNEQNDVRTEEFRTKRLWQDK